MASAPLPVPWARPRPEPRPELLDYTPLPAWPVPPGPAWRLPETFADIVWSWQLAPTVDAHSSGNTGTGTAASLTFTHTMGTVSNGAVFATCHPFTQIGVTTITATYNGVAMTAIVNNSGAITCAVWMFVLVNPPAGASSIVFTVTGTSSRMVGTAVSYSGVDQVTPVAASGASNHNNAYTTLHETIAPTSSGSQIVVIGCSKKDSTETFAADDTEDVKDVTTNATGANNIRGGMSHAAAATATVGWSNSTTARGYSIAWAAVNAAGATTYTLTVSGLITPAGSVKKSVAKPLTGKTTPAGAVVKSVTKALTGTTTPAGTIVKSVGKPLSGRVTPAGTVTRAVAKPLTGAVTPAGSLVKSVSKVFSGAVTPIGTLSKAVGKTAAGIVTPVGSLARTVAKALTGAITPTGSLARTVGKVLSGLISGIGTLVSVLIPGAHPSGSSPAGTVTAVTPAGSVSSMPSGTVTASSPGGSVSVSPAGYVESTTSPNGEVH